MNNFFKVFSLLIAIVMTACNDKHESGKLYGECSHELISNYNKIDTVNFIYDGKKQGRWVVIKDVIPKASILPTDTKGTLPDKVIRMIIEEGYYKDDKKEGYWKYYNEEDGSFKDSVAYKNGVVVK